jgi:transcriptional regulator with XRE-family HTH domain
MEIGKKIVKIRKDNKLTQDDLADKYYVTRQTISNWENGKSYPDLETLVKISDDFNISLDILLKEDDKMIKDISKGQKYNKLFKKFVVALNIIGILCLIYFATLYVFHDTSIRNPNSMLPTYSWDSCGFILTIGLIPLVVANVMAYVFLDAKIKWLKIAYFIPSIICILFVGHYLIFATEWTDENKSELVSAFKCSANGEVYEYQIYYEDNETHKDVYSVGMDDNDKIPTSVIDYTSEETIHESIEKYYKSIGGMCP